MLNLVCLDNVLGIGMEQIELLLIKYEDISSIRGILGHLTNPSSTLLDVKSMTADRIRNGAEITGRPCEIRNLLFLEHLYAQTRRQTYTELHKPVKRKGESSFLDEFSSADRERESVAKLGHSPT